MVENVAPKQVWEALQAEPKAQLVDVRTQMEWDTVGLPDLSGAGKQPYLISWALPPAMQVNGAFIDQLRAAGLTPDDHIYFLCRSGARSTAAAHAAVAAGFPNAFNVASGFEGPPNAEGRTGRVAGWQADGLP